MRIRSFIVAVGMLWAVSLAAQDQASVAGVEVTELDFGDHEPGGQNEVSMLIRRAEGHGGLTLRVLLSDHDGENVLFQGKLRLRLGVGDTTRPVLAYDLPGPGSYRLAVSLKQGSQHILHSIESFSISRLHLADYGQALQSSGPVKLWWCDGTRKVSKTRPAPERRSSAVQIACAGGEYEPFQLVLNPDQPLKGLDVRTVDLASPGHTLPAAEVGICRVHYLKVEHPSDHTGGAGLWPDPLPPWSGPLDLDPGENQPIWFTVHVPAGTPAGDYEGLIQLSAQDWAEDVPLRLHVWGFDLPTQPSLKSAFGIDAGAIWRYQNVSEANRAKVWDLTMQNFRDHRIAPYGFALSGIQSSVEKDEATGQVTVKLDCDAWDQEAKRCLDDYKFTGFRLGLPGMDGDEAAYQAYCGQLQEHLKSRGWLDKAYIYWFDEPLPKDYPTVKAGNERIKTACPGLRRMLTEEPVEPLFGSVDIWCPLISNYDPEVCQARQKLGEEIWWYVCTGPKAPYPGLFIDRDAMDMRIWIWMTRKYGVQGILVWATTYWSSSTAFPDSIQNPWEDPMGYQSGYGLPSGAKVYWGNGDGRFLYPANPAVGQDVREFATAPVNSIRWEMLREGMEDYEYFNLLKKAVAQARQRGKDEALLEQAEALLTIGDDIVQDPKHYTRDPQRLLDRRLALAEMIESLGPGR